MKSRPTTRVLTQSLILLDVIIWFGFAILTGLGLHPAIPEGNLYRWGMSAMAFIAGIMLLSLYYLSGRSRIAYFLLLGVLAMISFLTLADEFGIYDLIVLILHVLAFLLLIIDKNGYFSQDFFKDINK